ncbi:hypothetical protein JJQ59_20070 [Cupriavidus necator]|uniref:Lipoprotein n=1 Tax=Cupriavidus necator TaxID=106590 RepID=A0A367P886_CUPNE|nr:hypothetical protein [Cupriavidus necator]QQX87726.1 hypothetical protein JJQ59_20070 [Cupriavidus necator]RCJ04049.1 hypothetical protein DDK22_33895 [Cupriavidus necator]
MRTHLPLLPAFAALIVAGCNTAPIPPGKPVDIPTALQQVAAGLCAFKKDAEARRLGSFDSVTVELDLTIDGAKDPPVAVAPDIQFMPTVSYGQTISVTKGSKLTLTLKNVGACDMSK